MGLFKKDLCTCDSINFAVEGHTRMGFVYCLRCNKHIKMSDAFNRIFRRADDTLGRERKNIRKNLILNDSNS